MKEIFIKYVTMTDILGEPVSLRINNETTSKTFIGGLLTIQLVLAITIIFWVFSIDLLNHENPSIAEENQILHQRPAITMNKTSNQVAFSVTNDGSAVFDTPGYFKFSISHVFNNNSGYSEQVPVFLKYKKCQRDDFPDISEEIFNGISLDYMYCIDNLNHTIVGFWDELSIQYLTIRVSYCENQTETDNCAELSTIKDLIESASYYFNIYLINTSINPKNYSTPITRYILNKYSKFSSNSYKLIEVYLRNQQLHSDDSFIFTSDYRKDSSAFDFQEKDQSDINEENILIEYTFYSSNRFIIYHRTYQKISEVLADVGGLSSVFLVGLKIMCYMFTNMQHDEEILNKIFDYDLEDIGKDFADKNSSGIFQPKNRVADKRNSFETDFLQKVKVLQVDKSPNSSYSSSNDNSEKANESKNDKEQKMIPTQNVLNIGGNINKSHLNNFSIHSIDSHIVEKINNFNNNDSKFIKTKKLEPLPRIREFKRSRRMTLINLEPKPEEGYEKTIKTILSTKKDKYRLKFSFCETIKVFIFPCLLDKKTNHKYQLYKKSEAVLEDFLDISYIVHKLDEYEKFKIIMMTKEQLALFNFISKDLCSLNKDKLSSSSLNEMKQYKKDEDTLAKVLIQFMEKLSRETDENNIPDIDKKLFAFLHEEFKSNLIARQ